MKLKVQKRAAGKQINALRREGQIPAVLYGRGQSGAAITVQLDELQSIMRGLKSGLLSTAVFELHGEGAPQKAIIKEIQYHPVSYAVQHIDFALLSDGHPVTVSVPIQIAGAVDCAGVKLGGFVRQVVRSMKVSCLPKDIPQEFVVDVKEMNVGESKRLSDISLGNNVRALGKLDEVAVIIGKRKGT